MLHIGQKLLCGLMLLLSFAGAVAGDLQVKHARLRLLPGDVPVAGYFCLENTSGEPVVLVGAKSPVFERIMMHRSVHEDGMARMKRVPRLELARGERVAFAPGGYHLMAMDRTTTIVVGDQVTITLQFRDGRRKAVVFRAVSPGSHAHGSCSMEHHSVDHHAMGHHPIKQHTHDQ